MGAGGVRSGSCPTRPAVPYCVTLGLELAHLLSGPCQLFNYQLLMEGQEKEDKAEVVVTQASAFGVLGQECLQPGEGPYSPCQSHMSFSVPLSGLRRGQRKGKFQLSFPETTKDESWGPLFL